MEIRFVELGSCYECDNNPPLTDWFSVSEEEYKSIQEKLKCVRTGWGLEVKYSSKEILEILDKKYFKYEEEQKKYLAAEKKRKETREKTALERKKKQLEKLKKALECEDTYD